MCKKIILKPFFSNVSWCLERVPPPVPTCPPAPDCGAPHLEERSMDVRPNTCPGLMVLHVVMTGGVSDHNVSPNIRHSVSWMESGDSGRVGVHVPDHVEEVSENPSENVIHLPPLMVVCTALETE